jgi:F-type H+-transporting ATPase subunit c
MKLSTLSTITAAIGLVLATSGIASAETAEAVTSTDWKSLAGPIGLGIAVFGAGLGQGKIASAFLEGTARNPGASSSMFVPLMLGLAFVESLVILTWLKV